MRSFFISLSKLKINYINPYIKVVVVSMIVSALLVIILKEFGLDLSAVIIAGGAAGGVSGALVGLKGEK